MLEIKLDEKKFANFMQSLVMMRFETLSDINNFIYNKTDIKVDLIYDEQLNEDERLEGYDYCLKSNVTLNATDLCYLDVYFIRDNGGQFYITEVTTDFIT